MNKAIKAHVMSLLEKHPENMRKIAQLRYELTHSSTVSPAEMIEAMSLSRGSGDGQSPTGHISNKTLYIALNYQEAADRINSETRDKIVSKLIPLEQGVDRLEHYVSLLEERQALVIRGYYFERLSWDALCERMQSTPKTLRKARDAAVDVLVEMYKLLDESLPQ